MTERARAVAPRGAQQPVILNTTEVFRATREQGTGVAVLEPGPNGLRQLAGLALPDTVKAELSTSLANGHVLVVPAKEVTLDGRTQVGWWRVDRDLGEVLGVMVRGRGQAEIEYKITNAIVSFYGAWVSFAICTWAVVDSPNINRKALSCLIASAAGGVGSYSYFPFPVSPIAFIIGIIAAVFTLGP